MQLEFHAFEFSPLKVNVVGSIGIQASTGQSDVELQTVPQVDLSGCSNLAVVKGKSHSVNVLECFGPWLGLGTAQVRKDCRALLTLLKKLKS